MMNKTGFRLFDDMLQQTHLLIAGETGSGKSVLLNDIIRQLLFYSPKQKQMILLDPKKVELSDYRRLPHTLKYSDSDKSMLEALQYAMDICNKRFRIMQRQRIKTYRGSDIYVVIDELAFLLVKQRKAVEPLLMQIGQIGRAARIHLLCCTQRPTTDIINAGISVNIDSRVGLRTRSLQESRNIIGTNHLASLPQNGYCIYKTPKQFQCYQIPYLQDLSDFIRYWTKHKFIRL